MIEINGLTQSFGRNIVLDHVYVKIERNEILAALVGRNGVGKSTLINSLLGLLPIKKGTIKINGMQRKKRLSGEIAYLPEKFTLYPSLTGIENLIFFAKASSGKVDEDKVQDILQSVHLWEDSNVCVKHYSKGMLQRLGLAITFYQDSQMLILDEPTSGIDPIGRKEILEVLKSLKNKTILLSSHHIDEIEQICSHVILLENGKLQKFTVDEFLQIEHTGEKIG